jgi:hypothetical protein
MALQSACRRFVDQHWTVTEVSSALSLKLRVGAITSRERAEALASFRRLVAEAFEVAALAPGSFWAASRIADQHELGVRAGDALHLAVATEQGASLCTLDDRMARAANTIGLAVVEP